MLIQTSKNSRNYDGQRVRTTNEVSGSEKSKHDTDGPIGADSGKKRPRRGMPADGAAADVAAAAAATPRCSISSAAICPNLNLFARFFLATPHKIYAHIRPVDSRESGSTSSHSIRDANNRDIHDFSSQETPPPAPEDDPTAEPSHDSRLLHSPILQKSMLVWDRMLHANANHRRLSDHDAALAAIGDEESSIDDLLGAMRSDPDSAQVQERGCAALTSLAKDGAKRSEIADAGGIAAIRDAMVRFPLDADLQGQGCSVLGNLAALDSNKLEIASAGCVVVVLDAMDEHVGVDTVQERACGVLFNLAFHHCNKELIAKDGGIQKIVRAMETHPECPGVQHNACCALWNLGGKYFYSSCRHSWFGYIMCSNTTPLLIPSIPTRSRLHIVLPGSVANKERIHETSGVHAIVRSMTAHRHHPHVQRSAIGALRTLSVHHGCKDHIAETGGVGAVIAAMETHPEEGNVQKEACGTLRNLLFHRTMRREIRRHRPHRFLEDAADNFPIECEENATRVLEKLSNSS